MREILAKARANSGDPEGFDALYGRVLDNVGGDERALAKTWSLAEALEELRTLVAESRMVNLGVVAEDFPSSFGLSQDARTEPKP